MNSPASGTRYSFIRGAGRLPHQERGPELFGPSPGSGRRTQALPNVPRRDGNQYGGQNDQYYRLQPKVLNKMSVEDVHVHPFHALGDV